MKLFTINSFKLGKPTALLLCSVMLFTACANGEEASSGKTSTAKAERGNLLIGHTADGKVALPVTNLNFEVDGIIKNVYFSEGDEIEEGDLLAELDDTDYQLDITNAENNLEKARIAYDDAVWQYEYGLKSDLNELNSLKKTIGGDFDDYTYQNNIADAEADLESKKKALEEAEALVKDPFDELNYNRSIADSEANLKTKREELKTAKKAESTEFDDYNYQLTISDAQKNLEKKQTELEKAYDNLDDALEAEDKESFDDYTYMNSINSANTAYERKYADWEAAKASYEQAQADYNAAVTNEEKAAAAQKVTELKKALDTANNAKADAYETLLKAISDRERAWTSNVGTLSDNVTKAKEAIETAEEAVIAAKTSLEKAQTDLTRAIDSFNESQKTSAENKAETVKKAEEVVKSAEQSLKRLKEDKAIAKKDAEENAQEKLESAKEAVKNAEKSLARAKTNLERAYDDFIEQKQSTSQTYEMKTESYEKEKSTNTSIMNAELNIKDAELALEEALNKLEKVKIYAPKSGQIVSINQSVGEQVSGKNNSPESMIFGTSGSSGNFIVICDLSEIYLTASITEGDIIGIEVGQTVRVTVDSIGEEEYMGKVNTVSSLPTTDTSGITTYTVTARLDKQNTLIKDGMNCLLTFIKREETDVLMIPNKAVFVEDNKQYVNVELEDGSYEKRAVSCGLSNGTKTVVLDGLSEGETVVSGKVK